MMPKRQINKPNGGNYSMSTEPTNQPAQPTMKRRPTSRISVRAGLIEETEEIKNQPRRSAPTSGFSRVLTVPGRRRRKRAKSRATLAIPMRRVARYLAKVIGCSAFIVVAACTTLAILRPTRSNVSQTIAPGIVYHRKFVNEVRPAMIHIAEIDLSNPNISFFVTPPTTFNMVPARTTSTFLKEFKATLAVNGGLFSPQHWNNPIDYFPHHGDKVRMMGQSIANGVAYSEQRSGWAVLCINLKQRVPSIGKWECPAGTDFGVSGNGILVEDGILKLGKNNAGEPRPRTGVGLNDITQKLWLVVVDGRQPFYSDGIDKYELAKLIMDLGATEAMELDSGGSSTMVASIDGKAKLINSPVHTGIPLRERPVGNHLGVIVKP